MPVAEQQKRYTYQDYCTWNDDERWELIAGLPYNMSPAPTIRHQNLAGNFFALLKSKLKNHTCRVYMPPTDVVLSECDIVQPDTLVVCDSKKITEANIQGAPDLIIEVLSPSTAAKDRWNKRNLYEKHGVKEYLLVDPDGEYIERYILGSDGAYGKSDLFNKDESIKLVSLPEIEIPLLEGFDNA